jgi:hypothetical protein
MHLIDLQSDTRLNQSFLNNNFEDFSAYLPKENVMYQTFWIKNDSNVQQQVHVRTFFPIVNTETESPPLISKLSARQRAISL